MKNYIKLLITLLVVAAPMAQADFDLSSVKNVVSKVGTPEEAKKMYQSAKDGYSKAADEVKRLKGEIQKIKANCPASAFNPLGKNFKKSCAQDAATLAVDEIKLKAAQAKELWNSELMMKLRDLIDKNWPAVKKQLGL